jgi:hypothetical protein
MRECLRPKPGARALDAGLRKQDRRLADPALSVGYRVLTEA